MLRSHFARGLIIAISTVLWAGCSTTTNPIKGFGKHGKNQKVDAGPKLGEDQYYAKGLVALKKKQYDEAARNFEAIETYYPVGNLTEQAVLNLIYTRYKQDQFSQAKDVADRFIRNYPASARLDYVYYARAMSALHEGYDALMRFARMRQSERDVGFLITARNAFKELIDRYPLSAYTISAKDQLALIQNELAENEMVVARFNVARKAWLGANERAKVVLELYPASPQAREALATLIYSYQKLGLNELADNYRKKLLEQFSYSDKPERIMIKALNSSTWLKTAMQSTKTNERILTSYPLPSPNAPQ